MNSFSKILRTTKSGEIFQNELPGNDWITFTANHSTYEPLELAMLYSEFENGSNFFFKIMMITKSEINRKCFFLRYDREPCSNGD